jgi:hypothetical protein
MPQLPPHALEHGIRAGQGLQLELGGRGEAVAGEAAAGLLLLVRVVLPLDVALPALALLAHDKVRVVVRGAGPQLGGVADGEVGGAGGDGDAALVPQAEADGVEALLELPLVAWLCMDVGN